MINSAKASRTIQLVLKQLILGNYVAVERLTKGSRLSAIEIEQAIDEYGRRLVSPPSFKEPRSVVEIEASMPPSWSVYVDLWTAEEGRSDLTLELTLTETDGDTYEIQVDNIHVL